jgi:hypothetical protein
VTDQAIRAVPRLAGDRSAQRIRGSVSDSVAFERAENEPSTDPSVAFGDSSPQGGERLRLASPSQALSPSPARQHRRHRTLQCRGERPKDLDFLDRRVTVGEDTFDRGIKHDAPIGVSQSL